MLQQEPRFAKISTGHQTKPQFEGLPQTPQTKLQITMSNRQGVTSSVSKKYLFYSCFILRVLTTSAPIRSWKCNCLPFQDALKDKPTNQPIKNVEIKKYIRERGQCQGCERWTECRSGRCPSQRCSASKLFSELFVPRQLPIAQFDK